MDTNTLKNKLADPTIAAMDDATAAKTLSVPVLTPKTRSITYTSAGASLGGIKAATLRATLLSSQVQASALGPVAAYADTLLGGPGFDATNADVQTLTAQFVVSGILTQADANLLLNDSAYLCGGIVATADVTAARESIARQATFDTLRQKVTSAYSTFSNEVLNVAESDPKKPVPTYDDFIAAVQAGK